jgi:HK97 family phage major capsid protein
MSEMIKRLMAKLDAADERRSVAITARKALLDTAEAEQRADLTEDEATEFRAKTDEIKAIDAEITELRERVAELEAEEARTAEAAKRAAERKLPVGGAQVTSEELTYRKGNGRSYIRDLAQGTIMNDFEARERLARHANEVKKAPEFAEYRTASSLDRTDGTGGYFVPPAWLMSQWIELARPGRPTANLVSTQALPPGTDSISIPRVLTGTATAVQDGDGTAVQDTGLTDDSITVPVRTVAGTQTMSQQLLDQSPLNFDQIVFTDLLADYATKVDLQVISGTAANGQVRGLLNTSGIISVAAGGQTAADLYAAFADASQQMHTNRFRSPQVAVMHPRRWAYLLTQADSAGRPLVVPRAQNPQNAMGTGTLLAAEGPVGDLLGVPVILDANLATNLGAGTNEDRVVLFRPDDDLLYESSIRTRTLPEIKSNTLQVVVQVYGYLAFSAERYPKSTAVITGLTTPSF